MHTLIVDKASLRVQFITNPNTPLLLDALWPQVGFNVLLWPHQLPAETLATPWNFVFQGSKLVRSDLPSSLVKAMEENRIRANLLLDLARGTNRHRRQVVKEDLLGQDLVYGYKIEEAQRYLVDPVEPFGVFPWLTDAAAFDGITMKQAAEAVVFRHTQALMILRHTENRRRELTRAILTRPVEDLAQVRNEVMNYVRRG